VSSTVGEVGGEVGEVLGEVGEVGGEVDSATVSIPLLAGLNGGDSSSAGPFSVQEPPNLKTATGGMPANTS